LLHKNAIFYFIICIPELSALSGEGPQDGGLGVRGVQDSGAGLNVRGVQDSGRNVRGVKESGLNVREPAHGTKPPHSAQVGTILLY